MIVHDFLRNPVEQTEVMGPEVFNKYIGICNRQKEGEMTDPEMLATIHDDFFGAHPGVHKATLRGNWSWTKPKLEVNPGLAQFVLDFGATRSDFFFPWLVSVWNSPSAALEMAYGEGLDLTARWRTDILETKDEIVPFVHNVPTFVYNRERQLKVADLVTTFQDRATVKKPSKIVDFGAGRMAWARHHGFRFGTTKQMIYAFDKDTNINPYSLFNCPPLQTPAGWLKINYQHRDFVSQLGNPELTGADLVILGGVASYIPAETFFRKIVPAIYQMLKPGGCFFFDLQLQCPQYEWSVKLFDWPEIRLIDEPEEAIKMVEMSRKILFWDGIKFSAEYALDTGSVHTSSVMVTLTKL